MDSLPYVDTLFKEYLLFRGFTATLQCFSSELSADRCCGFQAEALCELIFGVLLPQCRTSQLMELLELLADRLYSQLDSRFEGVVERLEVALIKAALVACVRSGRQDKVSDFFRQHGDSMLAGPEAGVWRQWAALAFVPTPRKDPAFQAYFNPEWLSLLEVSFRNFLSQVMAALPLPAVLRFNADRRQRLALQQQVDSLQRQAEALAQQLAAAQQHAAEVEAAAGLTTSAEASGQQRTRQTAREVGDSTAPAVITAGAAGTGPGTGAGAVAGAAAGWRVAPSAVRVGPALPPSAARSAAAAAAAAAAMSAAGARGPSATAIQLSLPQSPPSPQEPGPPSPPRPQLSQPAQPLEQQRSQVGSAQTAPVRTPLGGETAAAAVGTSDAVPGAGPGAVTASGHQPPPHHHGRTLSLEAWHSVNADELELISPTVAGGRVHPNSGPAGSGRRSGADAAAGGGGGSSGRFDGFGVRETCPAVAGLGAAEPAAGGVAPTLPAVAEEDVRAETAPAAQPPAQEQAEPPNHPSQQHQLPSEQRGLGHQGEGEIDAEAEGDPAAMLVAGPAVAFDSDGGGEVVVYDNDEDAKHGDDSYQELALDGADEHEEREIEARGGEGGGSGHSDGAVAGPAAVAVAAVAGGGGAQPRRQPSGGAPTVVGGGRWCGVGAPYAAPPGALHGRGSAVLAAQFSPGGGHNVATGAADGSVAIWAVAAGGGGGGAGGGTGGGSGAQAAVAAAREARLSCGAPVTCVAWDARADKVMLVGTAGRGIRAWHADTRRVSAEIPPDPAAPWVSQLACSRKDPVFIVAAATGPPLSWAAAAASSEQQRLGGAGAAVAGGSAAVGVSGRSSGDSGRLSIWNMRAFKRVSSYSVPQESPVLSLAFNAQGSWFAAGTSCGVVHLYDSSSGGSRPQPLSTFRANAPPPGSSAPATSAPAAVQVYDNSAETVLVSCCGATVRLWSLRRLAEPLLSVPLLPYLPYGGAAGGGWSPDWAPCMALSPRGAAAAVVLGGGGPALYVVDLQGGGNSSAPDEGSGGSSGWLGGVFGSPSSSSSNAAGHASALAAAAAAAGRVSVTVPYSGGGGGSLGGLLAGGGVGGGVDDLLQQPQQQRQQANWRDEYGSDDGGGEAADHGEAAVYGTSCSWHPSRDVLVVGYCDGAVQAVGLARSSGSGGSGGGGGS